jgi:plastocyanin
MAQGRVLTAIAAMLLGGGSALALADTIQVTIDKLVFAPAEISAKVGDTIEWVNKDVVAHTATVKGGWDVMIPAKASARMVVEKPESVDYYCRFHPNMKGKLTATAR